MALCRVVVARARGGPNSGRSGGAGYKPRPDGPTLRRNGRSFRNSAGSSGWIDRSGSGPPLPAPMGLFRQPRGPAFSRDGGHCVVRPAGEPFRADRLAPSGLRRGCTSHGRLCPSVASSLVRTIGTLMTLSIPLSTHLFLLAIPALIAGLSIWRFVRGGRRER